MDGEKDFKTWRKRVEKVQISKIQKSGALMKLKDDLRFEGMKGKSF